MSCVFTQLYRLHSFYCSQRVQKFLLCFLQSLFTVQQLTLNTGSPRYWRMEGVSASRSCCGKGKQNGFVCYLGFAIRVGYTCWCSVSPEERVLWRLGTGWRNRQRWLQPQLSPWVACPAGWGSAPRPLIYSTCLNWWVENREVTETLTLESVTQIYLRFCINSYNSAVHVF